MEIYESKVAKFLLQSNAIKLEPTKPFTWASGIKSPIYCDNRLTLSFPEIRDYIKSLFVKLINKHFTTVEVIAGVATGGIAQGAMVADELNLPFIYVRSSPKGHGMENLVEGLVQPGKKVVVIEDLISTGGSSLKAVSALRAAGFEVIGMCAIFTYGFKIASNGFNDNKCKLITLSNYSILIEKALEQNIITDSELKVLKEWSKDPENWNP